MSDIRANTEAIKTAAGKFATQSVSLADLITAVGNDIAALEGLWTGPAASQFRDLMTEWHKDSNDIQMMLEAVANRVEKSGLGYEDLDTQIKNGFTPY
jgi:WXG100 family type VII secretion target